MNKNMIVVAVLAASVAGIGPASAQDHHGNGRHGGPAQKRQYEDRDDHRYDRSDERRNDRADYHHDDDRDHDRGAGPRHDLRKGGRLPAEYRGRQYVVDDWRGHHLSAPPRGYYWVQTGGDYVLVAIATGLIVSLLLNN